MAGHIVCGPDGNWRRTRTGRAGTTYPAYIGDPSAQVQRNIFALRHLLRRRLPDLFLRTPLWIEGLVVFAHSGTQLDAARSKVPAVVLEEMTERIRTHRPRRPLAPSEVDDIVAALLDERQAAEGARADATECAGAGGGCPGVAAGSWSAARHHCRKSHSPGPTAVIAVAHEAARAAALGNSPTDAMARMHERAALVAPGMGLEPRNLVLGWDVSHFTADPAEVIATVDYPVDLSDLPLIGGLPP